MSDSTELPSRPAINDDCCVPCPYLETPHRNEGVHKRSGDTKRTLIKPYEPQGESLECMECLSGWVLCVHGPRLRPGLHPKWFPVPEPSHRSDWPLQPRSAPLQNTPLSMKQAITKFIVNRERVLLSLTYPGAPEATA